MSYVDVAKKTYGASCEFIGCGWNAASCDVHHINYQEQQTTEKALRQFLIHNKMEPFAQLLAHAVDRGFLAFDMKTRQLAKDDRSQNLAVLCPNHHRYLHTVDMGMKILEYIPPRR
jgi:hypothetical protein